MHSHFQADRFCLFLLEKYPTQWEICNLHFCEFVPLDWIITTVDIASVGGGTDGDGGDSLGNHTHHNLNHTHNQLDILNNHFHLGSGFSC